ncbi:MAG: hypothetical protein EHM12_10210 [Dehalococcoidia bacterium]|nr:MAG: hypothetical protein EHM12_10210 [Dehalococcoidia bacterium]
MQKKVVELLKKWKLQLEQAEIALGIYEETEEEIAIRRAETEYEQGSNEGWCSACEVFVADLKELLLEDLVEKNSEEEVK